MQGLFRISSPTYSILKEYVLVQDVSLLGSFMENHDNARMGEAKLFMCYKFAGTHNCLPSFDIFGHRYPEDRCSFDCSFWKWNPNRLVTRSSEVFYTF